jgi:cullin-associated NEDD8-dissociated protein 1
MAAAFNLQSTLEKMANRDKDFRYMASSDLLTELGKETFKLDADGERRLTAAVLKLLEDNSGDVQGIAVKCVGPLIRRVNETQVGEISDQLANLLLKEKNDDVRDIASLGLKLAIENVQPKDGPLVVKRLSTRLITAVATENVKPETKLECLQALEDLLTRFGQLMSADLEKIQQAVLPQLVSTRSAARKRAIGVLSRLAVVTPEKLFTALVEHLLKSATEAKKSDHVRTYVQAVGGISATVGHRLGKYLNQIIPLVVKNIKAAGSEDEADEELRENCLATLEALVLRCPKEIQPHLEKVVATALEYIKHDPNYADDDGEEGEPMETDEAEEDGDDDEGDYSADDDVSWKVRRASSKVLGAVISTRPELLTTLYSKVAPALIGRFKEREETVKLDVFVTFTALLRQTNLVNRKTGAQGAKSPVGLLKEKVPSAVSALTKQLKQKSIKTRIGAFTVVRELVTVLGGGLSDQLKDIVPGIEYSLNDKTTNSNLRIETLTLLRTLIATHPVTAFHPHLKALIPPVVKAVNDSYYKIAAEALRVVAEIARVLRAPGSSFDHKPHVKPIYEATFGKLRATDTDQEVKETAINAMGVILANLGDEIGEKELREALGLLQDRLTNEITRLTTVKVVAKIAQSQLKLNLSSVLGDSVKELATFLRKQNRQLKQSSLGTLEVIIRNYGKEKGVSVAPVLAELAPLISDTDLHIAHLSLQLTTTILKAHPDSVGTVRDSLYPKTLDLLQSSLLQGAALSSLLSLNGELVAIGDKKLSYDALLDSFLGLTKKPLAKQCYSSIAQSVAVITAATDAGKRDATVARFIKDVQKSDEASQHIALLCLGEIGRRVNLEKQDTLQKIIFSAFESPSEEVKSAASFTLGNVAVGNLQKFLPFILSEVKNQPKRQYLLLHSLREIISRTAGVEGGKDLAGHLGAILPLLFENTESEEEGTRNVVAECLGKLAFAFPDKLLPELRGRLNAASPRARATLVSALKFSIVEQPAPIDAQLAPVMGDFLEALKDKELEVRRAALLTLNWAAHNKPTLVRENLPKYLPVLYSEAKIKPELIREVDLGPFKHKVDDGLENRKAAYEAMNTLLETCLDKVDVATFIAQLVEGLKDPSYDIKMLAHLMVSRLAHSAGNALLESLDHLIEPLRTTLTFKPPQTAVKQEIERNEELVRSALRSVVAISRIENIETSIKFEEFMRTTVKQGELAEKFEAIRQQEEPEGPGGDAMEL